MLDILVFIGLILLSATPVTEACFWVYSKAKYIENKLEKGTQLIVFSRYSLVLWVSYIFHFLKGFIIPVIASTYYFDNNTMLVICVAVLLGCHFFPFFLKFSFQKESLLFLWGLYTFIVPEFFYIFPIFFLLLSLIFASFLLGKLFSVTGMFFFIWFLELQAIYLPINFIIFLIVFISYYNDVIDHIEKQSHSILMAFKGR